MLRCHKYEEDCHGKVTHRGFDEEGSDCGIKIMNKGKMFHNEQMKK